VYPEYDNQIVDAFVFDRNGNLINRITPSDPFYGTYAPQMSRGGKFLSYPMLSMEIAIIDCVQAIFLNAITPSPNGRDLQTIFVSPDGGFLCAGGHSAGKVIQFGTGNQIWQGTAPVGINDFSIVRCSNNASFISCNTRRGEYPNYYNNQSIYCNNSCIFSTDFGYSLIFHTDVSPSGSFLISEKDTQERAVPPVIVQRISGGL
jgi:hypothetical protein